MQKFRGIKFGLLAVMLILAVSACAACNRNKTAHEGWLNSGTTARNTGIGVGFGDNMDRSGAQVIEGYLVELDKNQVTIQRVEFLTKSHSNRINELGLNTESDFRNGYYIREDNSLERLTYPLADNVRIRLAHEAGQSNDAQMPGYTPHNVSTQVAPESAIPGHLGHALGGVAGGSFGGLELLNGRYTTSGAINDRIPYFFTIENGYVTDIEEVGAYSNFAGTGTGLNYHTVNNPGINR